MTHTRITHAFVVLLSVLGISACGGHGGGDEPNPPSDLKVVELQGGAHLTWKDNSDNEGSFMLERKIGTGNFEVYKTLDFNTTDYHDAGVTAGMNYSYRVMAMPKSGGHSPGAGKYSNEVPFMLGS